MEEQLYTFCLLTATGAALALAFDCYRAVRIALRWRALATALGDLLYWLLAAVTVFGALLKGNWGEIRFYVFLALASGAGLYYRFLSAYVMHLLAKALVVAARLLRMAGAVLRFLLIRPLLLPLRWLFRRAAAVGAIWRRRFGAKPGNPPDL
ncbi:MAG: spore cortex biosynthesis protein YabQ [Sporomusaceae bacterium]|nr:spore cortex biosynthesis protein YabQ [Sporomusaceae bacterium]